MNGVMAWWHAVDELVPDEPLAVFSIVCLSILFASSMSTVFATRLRPSLIRSVGAAVVAVVACILVVDKFQRWHTAPLYALLHGGLALMSIDTLRALWREATQPRDCVCTVSCQAISCSVKTCKKRRVFPIVPVHVDGGQEKRDG